MNRFTLEQKPEWLKITIPMTKNWLFFILYSVSMLVWLGMSSLVLWAIFSQGFGWLLTLMLLIWLYIWYRLGRVLWRQWQFHAANREILFVNEEELIVRRPLSLLGLTAVYDMSHVSPFFYSEKHQATAFTYGGQRPIFVGLGLEATAALQLVQEINGRFFPDFDDEDDEDE